MAELSLKSPPLSPGRETMLGEGEGPVTLWLDSTEGNLTSSVRIEHGLTGTLEMGAILLPSVVAIPGGRWRVFASVQSGRDVVSVNASRTYDREAGRGAVLVAAGMRVPCGVMWGAAGPGGATVDGVAYLPGAAVRGPGSRFVNLGSVVFEV
jgi:hypothetical protein